MEPKSRPKITTGYGDDGWTYAGIHKQCAKDDFVIDTLGDLDELNCWLGRTRELYPQFDEDLKTIQGNIFELGVFVVQYRPPFTLEDVRWLESKSVELEKDLPDLKNFILPHYPSEVHIARAVCRRVERKLCSFMRQANRMMSELPINESVDSEGFKFIVPYINRLSDYLFIMARYLCYSAGKTETIWQGTKLEASK